MALRHQWQADSKLWNEFGFGNKPTVRQQLLALTVIRVGEFGPEEFSTNIISKDLKIAAGTINYHFGSREGLIAEASVVGYRRYIERAWDMAETEKKNPEKRLRLWLEESLEVQFEMHGWGPVFNYPAAFPEITKIINKKFGGEMDQLAALNMARLLYLVEDLSKKKVREFPYNNKKVPSAKLLSNPKLVAVTASIGWSNLGLAVWYSGRHLPTKQLTIKSTLTRQMMKFHIDHLIDLAKSGF